jgi:type IV pilus assembly protein PilB
LVRKKLGDLLVEAGVIDDSQLRSALAEQRQWGGQLGKILVELRFCSEQALVQTLSVQLGIPSVRLETRTPDDGALRLMQADFCLENGVFPFAYTAQGKFLDVAMADPTDIKLVDDVRVLTRSSPRAYLAGPKQIEAAIRKYYFKEPVNESGGIDSWGVGTSADLAGPSLGEATTGGNSGRTEHHEALAARVAALEAREDRNEQVIKRVLRLLAEKGVATRDEIKKRLQGE